MKALHEDSTQGFVERDQSSGVSPVVFRRKRGVSSRETFTFLDVKPNATTRD